MPTADPSLATAVLAPPLLAAAGALAAARLSAVASAWRTARGATTAMTLVSLLLVALRASGQTGANSVVRLDNVTVVAVTLISVVAWVVVRFSASYMAGDPGQRRYLVRLLATVAATALVVVTNHLAVLVAAWAAASVALHGLLTFYRDRPVAVAVAHKKFLLARCADLAMIGATVAFWVAYDTLRLDRIAAAAAQPGGLPGTAQVGILLVAVAVVMKCAQLPFHGWLIQVMEAPTPVSALLHAGVVNLGGVVLVRFAPVVDATTAARTLLVVVGLGTAAVAGLVMTTRVSIKVALAWSTCAQMGFMLLQCGLGLWEMAMLHLVAHSIYKAYSFLGAGGMVVHTQRQRLIAPPAAPRPSDVGGAVALALLGAAVATGLWLALPLDRPSATVLLMVGIVAVAVVPLAAADAWWRRAARAVAVPAAYLVLHEIAAEVVPGGAPAPVALLVVTGVVVAVLFAMQSIVRLAPNGRIATAARPWIYAGLFLDDVITRAVFRAVPPPSVVATPQFLPRPHVVVADISVLSAGTPTEHVPAASN